MTPTSNKKRNVTLGFSVTPAEEQAVKRKMVEDGYPSVSQWLRDTVNSVLDGRSAVAEDRQLMLTELVQASQTIATQAAKQIAVEFAKREATAAAEFDRRIRVMEGFNKAAMTAYSAQVTDLHRTIEELVTEAQKIGR